MNISSFIKTTRMNFLPASLIPFFMGASLAVQKGFAITPAKLILASIGVASAHLAGNVFNELYDNKSGADLADNRRSPFFGGSKAIKDGLVSFSEVLTIGVILLSVSLSCGITIFLITKDPVYLLIMAAAAVLTVGYTAPPLKLSYRKLGELDIFILFGVLLVMGSYYLFSGAFSLESFFLSLPISFIILAVILCNEIPDASCDRQAGKMTLIASASEPLGANLYLTAALLSYVFIAVNVFIGVLSAYALFLVFFYIPAIKAYIMLKKSSKSYEVCIKASGMTVALHTLAGLGLIGAVLLK